MMRRAGLVLLLACAPACAYRYIERRVDALVQVVDEATRAGAATCAPVELALSQVHLEFARHELLEGDAPRAERHLTLAEPNGQAALRLSKEQKCSIPAATQETKTSERPGGATPASRSDSIAAAQRGAPHAKR